MRRLIERLEESDSYLKRELGKLKGDYFTVKIQGSKSGSTQFLTLSPVVLNALKRLIGKSDIGESEVMDRPDSKEAVRFWKKSTDRLIKKISDKIESTILYDLGKVAVKSVKIALDKKETDSAANMYSIKVNGKPIGWIQISYGENEWGFHPRDGVGYFDQWSSKRFEEIVKEARRAINRR